jgi:1,4-alpha-glucan branching enzyme
MARSNGIASVSQPTPASSGWSATSIGSTRQKARSTSTTPIQAVFAGWSATTRANAVFAFLRFGRDHVPPALAVSNMAPVPRRNYRIGVPGPGPWREIFKSDSAFYGGSNGGDAGLVQAQSDPMHGEPQSIELVLPPLATALYRAEM